MTEEQLPELKEFSDFTTFTVLGDIVNILAVTTEDGQICTVAEIGSHTYYLGDIPVDVGTAVIAWQYEHKRTLTDDELDKTINENM